MRTILLGLILSLGFAAMNAQASAKPKAKVAAAINEAQSALSEESAEDIEDRQVEEMTAEPIVEEGRQPAVVSAGPAEELLAGEMKLDSATTTATTVEPKAGSQIDVKAEDQIPVLTKTEAKTAASADPISRLVISLGIILAVAGGVYMFARFWASRRTGLKQHHQIKVLTQYGLGPKKSLAIIRVAGESILIGITDQNINMIKSLALLDEELPIEVPAQFNQELSRQVGPQSIASEILTASLHGSAEKSEKEEFSFGHVRDMVASKLREMRSL